VYSSNKRLRPLSNKLQGKALFCYRSVFSLSFLVECVRVGLLSVIGNRVSLSLGNGIEY